MDIFAFFRRPTPIGLDLGANSIKLVALQGKPGNATLTHFSMLPTPVETLLDGKIHNPRRLALAIQKCFSEAKLDAYRAHITMSSSYAIIRHLTVPLMSRKDMHQAILFQAETQLPIPLDEMVIDYAFYGEAGPQNIQKVLLVAIQKEMVAGLMEAFELAKVKPISMEICALAEYRALAAQISQDIQPEDFVAFVSLGSAHAVFSIFQNEILQKSRVIHLSAKTESIAAAINQSLDYYLIENRNPGKGHIYIIGAEPLNQQLLFLLKSHVGKNISLAMGNPLVGVNLPEFITPNQKTLLKSHFVNALGLAMKGLRS